MAATEYDPRRPRLPSALAARIDQARGEVPFDRWVRGALERQLANAETPPATQHAIAEPRPPRVSRSPSLDRFR